MLIGWSRGDEKMKHQKRIVLAEFKCWYSSVNKIPVMMINLDQETFLIVNLIVLLTWKEFLQIHGSPTWKLDTQN